MSHSKIILRALPNVEFVHGYPGIPAGPERPQATIRGTIEVRLGNQPVKVKWIRVDFRKVETIPSGNNGEEFIDFVGQSPITVWQAQEEDETLSTKDFPFNIRVPETIPPSVALGRGAGIKYEVVATLCMKGKKGVFRREASTTISNSVPVVIDKHELHSTWPVYAQPESRQVTSDGLTLVVNRSNTCFAPADRLSVMATLKSDSLSPVVLRGFEFSLKETIIYRAGPQSHSKKNGPQVHTSTLGEQRVPVSMTLYGGTQHKAELGCIIPGNHTTSSVNAGRHIDIGYTMNVKAILDKAKPIAMDLPVTITNWPRHVSADMIRRIGTAPNLSLTLGGPGIPTVPQASDPRPSFGSPRPAPAGSLSNSLNNGAHQTVSPGTIISGGPTSPVPGNSVNGKNMSASGLYAISGLITQRPINSEAQQTHPTTTSQHSLGSGSASGNPGSISLEKDPGNDKSVPVGPASEFGYRQSGNIRHMTAPRHSQSDDSGVLGVIDVTSRVGSMGSHPASIAPVTGNESDTGGPGRISQHVVDMRTNVPSLTSSIRRPRIASRTLLIVNANDDIPEDDSPVNDAPSKPFDDPQSPKQVLQSGSPPVAQASSTSPWPTAEAEKQRLFDKAKAQAEKIQARVRMNAVAGSSVQSNSPDSNGRGSPPPAQPKASVEIPRTQTSSSPEPSWPTAEDEKRRLFEQAQANVRRTQAMAKSTQSPPANGSVTRLTHHRTASANSSQDSGRPSVTSSPHTISAGAALYSHAIASMRSPAMAVPHFPQTGLSVARVSASQVESSSTVSSSITQQQPIAEDDKAAIRYREAQKAVERRLKEAEAPQDAPIAYDALFPSGRSNAVSPPAPLQAVLSPPLSEKETLRRAFEARDAAIAANEPLPPQPTHLAMSNGTQPTERAVSPPPAPPAPLSEKELLRRAFEARDAAMIRSGQAPVAISMQPGSRQSLIMRSGSISSHTESKERTPPPEKEQMRLAFENRDRALAAQHAPLPPEYSAPPPVFPAPALPSPSPNVVDNEPLTAAQEKAQLKARYAEEEADSGLQTEVLTATSFASLPADFEHASPPTEDSHRSESTEGYLHRDPTISAGKKRASQMITPPPPPPLPPLPPPPLPPPLLPRPPPEYIEETKREDMKNSAMQAVTLPMDFSAPLDLDFSSPGYEHGASSSSSVPPELRSS